MSTSASESEPRAIAVRVTKDALIVQLADGRTITQPLSLYPRLKDAEQRFRDHFELLGDGEYIHWPAIDEDLSVMGVVRGTPSLERGVLDGGR